MLTDAQVERYSRQIILPEVGARGQERLRAARVGVYGDDAAVKSAALMLGRAGIGALEVDERLGTLPEVAPDCWISRARGDSANIAVVLTGEEPPPHARIDGPIFRASGDSVDILVVLTGEEPPPDAGVWGIGWSTESLRPVVLGILGASVIVATLLPGSCLGCFPDTSPLNDADHPLRPEAAPAARTMLGALAANETLRVLLTAPARSRLTILDVGRGTAIVKEIQPVGCRFCKAPA